MLFTLSASACTVDLKVVTLSSSFMTRSPQSNSPTPNLVEVDILRSPFLRIEEALEKKKRNLSKRLQRLQQYDEDQKSGKKLTQDQIEALSKIAEVELTIELNKEILKTVQEHQKEWNKSLKARDVKEKKAVAKQEKEKEAQAKEEQEASDRKEDAPVEKASSSDSASIDSRQVIRQVLHHRELLEQLSRPIVRHSFAEGEFGAPRLSQQELQMLDELRNSYAPSFESCRTHNDFVKRLDEAATGVAAILDGKEKGEEVERRRAILHTVSSCAYFEHLKQNAATRKEKKDRARDARKEKVVEGAKECKPEEASAVTAVTASTPPRSKSPVVTFVDRPHSVVYIGMNNVEVESFGYDDSLPHPDYIAPDPVDYIPVIPGDHYSNVASAVSTPAGYSLQQMCNGSGFVYNPVPNQPASRFYSVNGTSGGEKESPPAAPKPSPSDSKEDSGWQTPVDARLVAPNFANRGTAVNFNMPNAPLVSAPPGFSLAPVFGGAASFAYNAMSNQPGSRYYNMNVPTGIAGNPNQAAPFNRRMPNNGRGGYNGNTNNGNVRA